eukprot:9481280-Pyramimonas_sp.AAC.1
MKWVSVSIKLQVWSFRGTGRTGRLVALLGSGRSDRQNSPTVPPSSMVSSSFARKVVHLIRFSSGGAAQQGSTPARQRRRMTADPSVGRISGQRSSGHILIRDVLVGDRAGIFSSETLLLVIEL